MPRLLALVVVLAAVVAGLLIPVTDAVAAPAVIVSPTTVNPGGSFTVSGTGCGGPDQAPPNTEEHPWRVWVGMGWINGTVPRTAPDGSWSVTLRTDATHPTGSGFVVAHCDRPGARVFSYEQVRLFIMPATPPPVAAPVPAPVTPPAPPPVARPTVPRSSAPAPASPPSAAPRTTTPTTPPSSAAPSTSPASPGPSAACTDCGRLAAEEPLEAGEQLSLSWTGFQPGEQVTVVMRSEPVTLGTFTTDATGTVTAALQLPDEAEAGAHTLTFSGPLSGDLVVLPFRVAAADGAAASAAGSAAEATSDDGALTPWLVGGGLAALLLGAGGVALHRRRTAPGV
ncbi:hypothetical protein SAMN05660748_1214 [Blastococcus aggregatus]|uniref:LPXTG-motif cell wall anchor domain-containing protein n=1 Tax=Blastococcus aggregatus TaxID=38502 RepID=A0A285V4I9_9ACTN|nr:hypothetical protein [Blastococcus aggregatus]SOC48518.1 hypothetical protein SAMN05660748_1214 [Blastococcus aggregatus]